MKTIKMLLLVLAITFGSVVSANALTIEKDPTSLNEKITKLLETLSNSDSNCSRSAGSGR